AQTTIPSRSSKAIPSLVIAPKADGASGSGDIEIEVQPPSSEDATGDLFTLRVRLGDIEEVYENVTLGMRGRNVAEAVNQASRLVTIVETQTSGALADRSPEKGRYAVTSEQCTALAIKSEDYIGNGPDRTGIAGFEVSEDVTMVGCPDIMAAYMAGS